MDFNDLANVKLPSEILSEEDKNKIALLFAPGPKAQTIPTTPKKNKLVKALFCPVVSEHFYNIRNQYIDLSFVKHDTCFSGYRPTVSINHPGAEAMLCNTMNIGKGTTNDLNLDKFGLCNYTSPKHAVLFYNEYEKMFEIINYSIFGTKVNQFYYGLGADYDSDTCPYAPAPMHTKGPIMDKKKSVDRLKCKCVEGGGDLTGAEDNAVVKHGALLKFGCVSFIFSVIDT